MPSFEQKLYTIRSVTSDTKNNTHLIRVSDQTPPPGPVYCMCPWLLSESNRYRPHCDSIGFLLLDRCQHQSSNPTNPVTQDPGRWLTGRRAFPRL